MNMEKADTSMGQKCEACNSKGFILGNVEGKGINVIQRCDVCQVFTGDSEATQYVYDLVCKLYENMH